MPTAHAGSAVCLQPVPFWASSYIRWAVLLLGLCDLTTSRALESPAHTDQEGDVHKPHEQGLGLGLGLALVCPVSKAKLIRQDVGSRKPGV